MMGYSKVALLFPVCPCHFQSFHHVKGIILHDKKTTTWSAMGRMKVESNDYIHVGGKM